jgi:ATP-dependent Clp protease ATP-binding subunit ClpB
MKLDITSEALDRIGEAGFDPVYGARPLKRAVQHQIEDPLAQKILSGEFGPGDIIKIDVSEENLEFAKSTQAAA